MNTQAQGSDEEDEMLSTINEGDSESLDSNYVDSKPPAKPASEAILPPGSSVQFYGLQEMSHLNDTTGTIEAYLNGIQGYSVRCQDGNVVNAKPGNLFRLASNDAHHDKEHKKKKKKSKREDNSHILETSQQILVDLCNEMKSLQSSIVSSTSTSTSIMTENISSNTTLLHQIQTEVDLLRSNLKQLDVTIESKATPSQILEMGKIRAIQSLVANVQADKDKTVQLYETHARRGYEEIERLRSDLEREREENAKLREEMHQIQSFANHGPLSPMKGSMNVYTGPSMYVNGNANNLDITKPGGGGDGETIGTFDDMTLDTKQTTDNTVAYETKSLKKRIIHMKKKLQVAQLEAKEADNLRSELESMRLKMEGMRKEGMEKDKIIQRLKEDIDGLKRGYSCGGVGNVAASAATTSAAANTVSVANPQTRSVTVTTTTKKKGANRWWNGL
jgi:predicted RNase H-like nuclease (RuvC/YqgF family)